MCFFQLINYLFQEHTQKELDTWRLVRVSEDFRVIALGLPTPRYPGHTLDPPLRSRFQARYIAPPSYEVGVLYKYDILVLIHLKFISFMWNIVQSNPHLCGIN